jgi:hypothetical protein
MTANLPVCLLDLLLRGIRLDGKLIVKLRFLHHGDEYASKLLVPRIEVICLGLLLAGLDVGECGA